MAQSLDRDEDVQKTTSAMESSGGQPFLSIPDAKTPWYLLGLEYSTSFAHWYEGPQGRRAVICAGGVDGKGFDADNCPVCAHVLDMYQEAKRMREDGDSAAADKLKNKANDLRAKGRVILKAIRGQYIVVKDKTGKHLEADFDTEAEENPAEIGLLSLTTAQWEGLIGLRNGENTPFIKSGSDLGNRVLWTKKERRKGRNTKYTQVVWGAEEEESEMPEIEIPEELAKLDLDQFGEIDEDEVLKVAEYLSGQDSEEPEEDEEVALEEDSEDEPDDDYLDDVESDEEEEDDEEENDEFKDDIPGEDDEEEEETPPKKKPAPKKSASEKKTPPKGKTATRNRASSKGSASKKSGKTRM